MQPRQVTVYLGTFNELLSTYPSLHVRSYYVLLCTACSMTHAPNWNAFGTTSFHLQTISSGTCASYLSPDHPVQLSPAPLTDL